MSNVHIVVKGDTLSKISKIYGVQVTELKNINHLPNPNKLEIGQKIMLRKKDVLGFQTLFLDKDRNPISNLSYCFEFAGKNITGMTGLDGLTKNIMTFSPNDQVRILIHRFDETLKQVATVVSGYGNKLVTLISPSVKVEAKTQKHPSLKPGESPNKKEKTKPAHDPQAPKSATTHKKDLGPKTTSATTSDGKPLTKVEGDIPDLSFLDEYTGEEIAKEDIESAAKELKCEAGLIFAIAKQESNKSSFFRLGKRTVPTILYERHQFARATKHAFDKAYPDISGVAYKRAKKDKAGNWIEKKSGAEIAVDNVYGPSGIFQYKRLVKAYQLNQEAALQACSWGKFQIMGFNFKTAGFADVKEFVKAVSKSDAEHLKAFLKFAKSNSTLLNGLRNKSFEKIAEGHNGTEWRSINPEYASNLEKFYLEYTNKK